MIEEIEMINKMHANTLSAQLIPIVSMIVRGKNI